MKGVVPDLVVGPHGENGLPGCLHGSAMDFAIRGALAVACLGLRSLVCQACRQLMPNDLRNRRSVMLEARKPPAQGAFTRRTQLAAYGIIAV
jgi:hypothetical protein